MKFMPDFLDRLPFRVENSHNVNDNEEKLQFAKSEGTNMKIQMEENGFSINHDYPSAASSQTISDDRNITRRNTVTGIEMPTISAWDAGYNVSNAIQGMFVLGLPYAVLHGGYMGVILIILAAIACYYTGNILIDCLYEDINGRRSRVRDSYVDVAVECWGGLGGHVVNVAQLIELLMTCVLYIVISGNLMASSFPEVSIGEAEWAIIATIFLIPCIFLRDLRAVSWFSMGCSIAQVVVLGITMLYCMIKVYSWQWNQLTFEIDSKEFPVSIGVIVFSYTSQIFLPSLEGSMENRSQFKPMLLWSYVASCLMKVLFSLVCFLTWGQLTKDVVSDNLPQGLRTAINVMLVVKALLSFPLPYYLSLQFIEESFFTNISGGWRTLLSSQRQVYKNLSDESVPIMQDTSFIESKKSPTSRDHEQESQEPNTNNLVVTLDETNKQNNFTGCPTCFSAAGDLHLWAMVLRGMLVVGILIMAVSIPHFALLMGLTGSLTGTSLAFLLPCSFHLKIKWKELNKAKICLDVGLFLAGILCLITGIYFSILGLYNAYHPLPQNYQTFENSTIGNNTRLTNENVNGPPWF